MCGISGIVAWDGPPPEPAALEASLDQLAHRGPDGRGIWYSEDRRVALGHTRLAIIDVAGGHQPLANEDGSIQVVFNGEIYNHVELQRQLEAAGHRFRTRSDTEVIVHLYEEFGLDCCQQLNGMWAFALWDGRARRLVLSRDRLGQKPLYFAERPHGIAFASELKALWALGSRPSAFDPRAVGDYLTLQYVPSDRCAFVGAEKVRPGEMVVATARGAERSSWWQAPVPRPTFEGDFEEAATALRELLRDAVRLCLRSDVPLGALLSGGLDSSVVVGLMAEAGAAPIHTFTAVFRESSYDEREYARAVSKRFSTRHQELLIEPPTAELVDRVVDQYDEPFADASALATWQICQRARAAVKVVLTGDGGDESLLGYERYRDFGNYLRQRRWLAPLMHGSGLRRLALRLCPDPRERTWRRRLRTAATLWDALPAEAYERWIAAFYGPWQRRLWHPPHGVDTQGGPKRIVAGLEDAFAGDWVAAAAGYDTVSYLPDAVLTKVDRASMAHGLESRAPLLDHRVVEFLATLPREWKLHPGMGSKHILRHACRDLLPPEVLHRGKMGFGLPLGDWYRGPLSGRLEEECRPRGELGAWLDAAVIAEIIEEHLHHVTDHTHRLWTLACLNRAARRIA